jgi:hypothetical protein
VSTSADSPSLARGVARERPDRHVDGTRVARIALVRERIRTGTYRPYAEDVAEQLAAWLFVEIDRPTRRRTLHERKAE